MRTVQMTRAMFGAMLLGSLVLATSAQAQTIAITGGTVYPVSGPKIEKGTVVIRDGTIVAVGATMDRVVPVGGELAVRPMLTLTATFDHRAVDGAYSAAFLDRLRRIIETSHWSVEV